MASDVIPVLLSPGAVFCGDPGCEWERVGGSFAEQANALADHLARDHGNRTEQ